MQNTTLEVTFHLTGVRWFKVRLWLGGQIIKVGARVIGCGIKFKGLE